MIGVDRQVADLGEDVEGNAPLRQASRREVEGDAVGLEDEAAVEELRRGVPGAARIGVLATGMEARRRTRDRGERWFGQHRGEAVRFERADGCGDIYGSTGDAGYDARAIEDFRVGVGIGGVLPVELEGARGDRAIKVDAELLEDGALEFDDAHLEHDLIAFGDLEQVQHRRRRAAGRPAVGRDEALGEVLRGLSLLGVRHRALEHDVRPRAIDRDCTARQRAFKQRLQGLGVDGDLEIELQDLLARGIEEEHVGLPRLAREEIGGVAVLEHDIDQPRIADDHVLHRGGQLENGTLLQPQPQRPRLLRVGHVDLGFRCADRRRHKAEGAGKQDADGEGSEQDVSDMAHARGNLVE